MSDLNPKCLPESFLRNMDPQERAKLGKSGKTMDERQAALDAKSEKVLQNRVAALLRLKDITFNWSSMRKKTTCIRGWVDFSFAIKGQAVAFECKVAGGKLSVEQEKIRSGLWKDGWEYRVITNEQQVVDFLKEHVK